jgi:anti-sigma B factor antagonist
MKVKTREIENAVIINLEGEMMLGYEANDFHEAIQSAIEKSKKNIAIDLCEVKFISSWGIGILIHGYTIATNEGISFKLACVPANINQTFTKIKIDTIFKQFESVEEALKS